MKQKIKTKKAQIEDNLVWWVLAIILFLILSFGLYYIYKLILTKT